MKKFKISPAMIIVLCLLLPTVAYYAFTSPYLISIKSDLDILNSQAWRIEKAREMGTTVDPEFQPKTFGRKLILAVYSPFYHLKSECEQWFERVEERANRRFKRWEGFQKFKERIFFFFYYWSPFLLGGGIIIFMLVNMISKKRQKRLGEVGVLNFASVVNIIQGVLCIFLALIGLMFFIWGGFILVIPCLSVGVLFCILAAALNARKKLAYFMQIIVSIAAIVFLSIVSYAARLPLALLFSAIIFVLAHSVILFCFLMDRDVWQYFDKFTNEDKSGFPPSRE